MAWSLNWLFKNELVLHKRNIRMKIYGWHGTPWRATPFIYITATAFDTSKYDPWHLSQPQFNDFYINMLNVEIPDNKWANCLQDKSNMVVRLELW